MRNKKGGSRLNRKKAIEIREFAGKPENRKVTQAEIGVRYGVSREAVNKILNFKTYDI